MKLTAFTTSSASPAIRGHEALIAEELAEVEAKAKASGKPERLFKELRYQTLNSWSCERRVVAKAEHLPERQNSALRRDLARERSR